MGKLFENLREKLLDLESLPEESKQAILKTMLEMQQTKANVLITGATGCGKSSTINALFKTEKAKEGVDVPVLLKKIIEENTYRLDYNNVTEKLLEDDLKYDDVIVALKTITENGMFA